VRRGLLFAPAAAVVATVASSVAGAAPSQERLEGRALVRALQDGGYVIYFRHAATDFSREDTNKRNLRDCRTQRNLNAKGRAHARAIGRGFRELRIPVGTVLASRYCRTRQTASLAFGRVRTTIDLSRFQLVATASPREWTALRRVAGRAALRIREYGVPAGTHPHDVAPARDGGVWYTAQGSGHLGWLDPKSGRTRQTALGAGSAPHGVIVGPDGAPWITDGGLNAIVRVDPRTRRVRRYPLPTSAGYANLNTATFDRRGVLWFTGQSGIYGRLEPNTGRLRLFRAPHGTGPYGITTTPSGAVYYASLAGSYLGRIDVRSGRATVLRPPTRNQGARRAWSDSRSRIWISEWNAGKLGMYDSRARRWREWRVPGSTPMPYAVFVDDRDTVWLSDFGSNALLRFDPRSARFTRLVLPSAGAEVRQLHGRRREVWGAESGTDKLVVITTR
jgi:virginiamycin B lyase